MLEKSVDPRKVFFRQQNLCDTLAGNSCSLVTITACPTSRAWKHLHQLRKSDTKTRNESDVYSCVSTHLWSECLMLLWVCFQQWICVCVCSYSLADLQGSQSIWALTPPVRGGVVELQCGWMYVERTPLDGMTVLESLPEAYVIPEDKKLKELWEHIWIERKSVSVFFCFKGYIKSKCSLFTYTPVSLFDLSV